MDTQNFMFSPSPSPPNNAQCLQFKFNPLSQYSYSIGMEDGNIVIMDLRRPSPRVCESLGQVRSIVSC